MADADLTIRLQGTDEVKAALQDIALTGANAFQQLTSAIEGGNFAGLAELIGGKVVGAIVAAAQAAFDFVEAQAKAVVQLNALAQASGATLTSMQGLRDTLEGAGFTGEQAMLAISRAVLKLANDSAIVAEKMRDQGLAEEQANQKVQTSITSVAEARLRLSEIGTKQAQTAVQDADSQTSAELRLARAKQHQIDLLSGTPDKAANALLDQQEAAQAVTSAQHAADAANIKAASDASHAPLDAAKAQESATSANTEALKALSDLLKEQLGNLKDIGAAIEGRNTEFISQVKPQELLQTEETRTTARGGNAKDPLQVMEQISRDLGSLPGMADKITATLRDLFPTRNTQALEKLTQQVIDNAKTPENLGKIVGPALTDKDVAASQSFENSVNTFKAAVEAFGQKTPGIISQAISGLTGHAAGGPISGPGSGTSDTAGIFALSRGEFVVRAAAVQKYGVDMFNALNGLEFPGMAMGGLVRPVRMAGGGPVPAGSTLNLTIDGNHFDGLRAPEHVASKLHNYAINRQTAQTGRKPSWVR